MDAAHFERTLTAFRRRVPFRPFTIALVNGERFEVDHPDALVVRGGMGLFIGPEGVPWVFDYAGVNHVIGDLMDQPTG